MREDLKPSKRTLKDRGKQVLVWTPVVVTATASVAGAYLLNKHLKLTRLAWLEARNTNSNLLDLFNEIKFAHDENYLALNVLARDVKDTADSLGDLLEAKK